MTLMPEAQLDTPLISAVGDSALLLTPRQGAFDARIQARLQSLARHLQSADAPVHFDEAVLGVNNLLVVFDPLALEAQRAKQLLLDLWQHPREDRALAREVEIPVVYGGDAGEDLPQLAAAAQLPVEDYVKRHSEATYTVACIGAYPGFAYMSGLPPELTAPRRATPRLKLAKGSVIVGGVQAGVMPCTGPSGWHVLGLTSREMFDVGRDPPCLLQPGDRVRFTVEGIRS
jgi:5-oxoprolinase (ATP-hydrolysing) subunit B